MFRILFLSLLAASAYATSVSPELHECPVCGLKSVEISLRSYSQFGEPARDLSDAPQFRFANVEICPGDLYASWSDAWGKITDGEKSKLAAFLKKPSIHLTEAERSVVAGHEDSFRKSVWFKPLWARTCDELRAADERRKFGSVMRMHFSGSYVGQNRVAEDWEDKLISGKKRSGRFGGISPASISAS